MAMDEREEATMTAVRRWMHDRPAWMWLAAGLVVVGLVAALAVVLPGDGGDDSAAIQDDPAATSTTSTPSTTTTVITTTTTAPTTTDLPASTTTTPRAPTTTASPRGPVPGAVMVIRAQPGGGSGEISVQWDAVADATGYRILRSNTDGGAFAVVADYDVETGHATVFEDGITVWAPASYPWIEYVEYGEPRVRWFQVVAYNPNGDAPPSVVVSGSPP